MLNFSYLQSLVTDLQKKDMAAFLKGATESIDPKCRLSRVLKTEEKLDELYGTSTKSSEATSSDTTTNNQGKITNSELKRGKFGYS